MKYIIKKTGTLIITLFIVSLLAFLAFQIIPGDPTTELLGTEATEESRQALRQELGLDRPVLVRYWDWLSGFVKGDMGESYNYRMPVSDMLADKLPVTALLTLLSFIFTIALSIPLGRQHKKQDNGSERHGAGPDNNERAALLYWHAGLLCPGKCV